MTIPTESLTLTRHLVLQNKFSLAIDAALRRAIAKFRFEVAECLLAGKWFDSKGEAKDKDGKPLKFGFGCVKPSPSGPVIPPATQAPSPVPPLAASSATRRHGRRRKRRRNRSTNAYAQPRKRRVPF